MLYSHRSLLGLITLAFIEHLSHTIRDVTSTTNDNSIHDVESGRLGKRM